MRAGTIIAGVLVMFVGLFFTLTLIGAIIGIPLIIIGFIVLLFGLILPASNKEVHIHHHKD